MKIAFTTTLTEKELEFPSGRKVSSIPNRTELQGKEINALIAKALESPAGKKKVANIKDTPKK